jgi:hypothetical protein
MVPVQLGNALLHVKVVAEEGARTRLDFDQDGPVIVISESLDAERANRAVAAIMPSLIKVLAQRFLN